ncbi:MAG TPA: ABC transporter permease [Acidimicrobiales bacterium]|jgi:ABC-2 type transport system permease protein
MSALAALTRTEARLLSREWAAMVFAFVFPPITLLILAGSFGDTPDSAFGGVLPSDFYVTGYLGVPLGAMALVGLPVVLASYRERDVLRRFAAFGVRTTTVVAAQALVTASLVMVAAVTVLAVAAPTYGVPAVDDPLGVTLGFLMGTATMIVLGVALGLVVKTARGAQALGLLAFFPMWLLSGGGPPPDVMSDPMRRIADVLPLTHAVAGIRDPWIGTGSVWGHLIVLGIWLGFGLSAVTYLIRRPN